MFEDGKFSRIHKFCITHKPLLLNATKDTTIIKLGDADLDFDHNVVVNVNKEFPEIGFYHNVFGGSAGIFAILNIIDANKEFYKNDDRISIYVYRKFISINKLGIKSPNYSGMRIVTREEAQAIDLNDIYENVEGFWIIAQEIPFIKNIYHQYTVAHDAVDFLKYTSIAIETGVISDIESVEFFETQGIISGGAEFGIYPIWLFKNVIGKLRLVSYEFANKYRPYSINSSTRCIAFCNERLGSFLIQKAIKNNEYGVADTCKIGYMNNITDCRTYVEG